MCLENFMFFLFEITGRVILISFVGVTSYQIQRQWNVLWYDVIAFELWILFIIFHFCFCKTWPLFFLYKLHLLFYYKKILFCIFVVSVYWFIYAFRKTLRNLQNCWLKRGKQIRRKKLRFIRFYRTDFGLQVVLNNVSYNNIVYMFIVSLFVNCFPHKVVRRFMRTRVISVAFSTISVSAFNRFINRCWMYENNVNLSSGVRTALEL